MTQSEGRTDRFDRLLVRQKLTAMVNRYTVHAVDGDGGEGPLIAVAQQKRLALKEQVFRQSLTRSTWRLGYPALGLEAVGTERSRRVAIARRIWNLALEDVPGPFRFHFDFRTDDGGLVMSSDRRRELRDAYDVRLPALPDGSRLDWRLGAAMAVALDALQSR